MQIINELKLDFDDVLIRPKRSKTGSRSQVGLTRCYKTLNSGQLIESVPIIASNMSTVGTFAMAKSLSKHKMLTCLHKFYPEKELIEFFTTEDISDLTFYTLGISDDDIAKLQRVSERIPMGISRICIDVANGYT
jgi:GMP reductase